MQLNEEAFCASFYNYENVYSELEKEISLVIDIAFAKGGPESVIKSYYSVMKCHQKSGPQSNKRLSLRTKLDWCLPNVLNADRMVAEVSALYLNGDKKNSLIRDKCVHNDKQSKVLDRIEKSDSMLPYLS